MKYNNLLPKKETLFKRFITSKKKVEEEIVKETLVDQTKEIPKNDWRDKYPDKKVQARTEDDFISNKVIQLKNVDDIDIIEPNNGKIVYDATNHLIKVVIDGTWVTISTIP